MDYGIHFVFNERVFDSHFQLWVIKEIRFLEFLGKQRGSKKD